MEKRTWDTDDVLYVFIWCFFVLAAAFYGLITWLDCKELFIRPCPIYAKTGWYCPGCGGTRAFRALLEGNLLASITYHPFVLYGVIVVTIYQSANTVKYITKGRFKGIRYQDRYLKIAIVLLLGTCLVKNGIRFW